MGSPVVVNNYNSDRRFPKFIGVHIASLPAVGVQDARSVGGRISSLRRQSSISLRF
jgi:hypothetical protein